uniref:Uncharacterized protein n=1 Tax=Oryza rufipogon TaxID=4529 RepID=A0A0E0QPB0_ORYRU
MAASSGWPWKGRDGESGVDNVSDARVGDMEIGTVVLMSRRSVTATMMLAVRDGGGFLLGLG